MAGRFHSLASWRSSAACIPFHGVPALAFLRLLLDLGRGLLHQRQDILGIHCRSCHAVQSSVDVPGAWRTPVVAVGTDPKMILNSARMSDAGLLDGALMPPPAIGARIGNPAKAGDMLANTVVGTLLAEAVVSPVRRQLAQSGVFRALRKDFANLPGENLDALLDPKLSARAKAEAMIKIRAFINAKLSNLFHPPPAVAGAAYELRVLNGIWATAPYLHNGSVPNLWELLKPARERRRASWSAAASSIRRTSATTAISRRSTTAASSPTPPTRLFRHGKS